MAGKSFQEKVERQAKKLGVHASAVPDVLARADAEGLSGKIPAEKPGAAIRGWISGQAGIRPHWFEGGAPKPPVDKELKKERKLNPWAFDVRNCDANGRYTAEALSRQSQLVRALGLERSQSIANAVGAKVGSTKPPRLPS